jgi:hypothetical protein
LHRGRTSTALGKEAAGSMDRCASGGSQAAAAKSVR